MRISSNRQVALPKALMDRLHLQPGDMVYVLQSDQEQQGLLVVPVERVSEWVRLGRAVEQGKTQYPAERMQDDGEPISD